MDSFVNFIFFSHPVKLRCWNGNGLKLPRSKLELHSTVHEKASVRSCNNNNEKKKTRRISWMPVIFSRRFYFNWLLLLRCMVLHPWVALRARHVHCSILKIWSLRYKLNSNYIANLNSILNRWCAVWILHYFPRWKKQWKMMTPLNLNSMYFLISNSAEPNKLCLLLKSIWFLD